MRRLLTAAAITGLLLAPAAAADLFVKAPIVPPVVPYNWAGFYAGGNIGYSWGGAGNDWNYYATGANLAATAGTCRPVGSALCAIGSDSARLDGVLGGVQIGYNWQIGTYVAGLEADFDGSGQRGSDTFGSLYPLNGTPGGTITTSYTEALDWFGTARARAGYVVGERWLIYATAGLAYGRVTTDGTASSSGISGIPAVVALGAPACTGGVCPVANWGSGTDKIGWAAGAGLEGAIVGNWSWRLEYLHIDLGNVTMSFATLPGCFGTAAGCGPVTAGTGSISSHITDEIVRAGFDYRFAGP